MFISGVVVDTFSDCFSHQLGYDPSGNNAAAR